LLELPRHGPSHSHCTPQPQDPDTIARGIVSLFQFYGLDNELLEKVVQWEVEAATDAASVFRAPTLCSKILSAYCKTVGNIYCREVIRPFVLSLVQQGRTLEVRLRAIYFVQSALYSLRLQLDPQKIKPTEKVDDNLRALRDCTQAMLVDITNSAAKLPMYDPTLMCDPYSKLMCIGSMLGKFATSA
jgi:hypothetical protein